MAKKENIKGTNVSRTKKDLRKRLPIENKIDRNVEKESEDNKTLEDTKEEINAKEVVIEKKTGFNVIEVVLIMIITLLFGGVLGGFITYTAVDCNPTTIEGEKLPNELSEFVQVYEELKENYYDTIDNNKLLEAGIEGMISYLGDPYSNYIDQEGSEDFYQRVDGEYIGIGAEVMKLQDDRVIITGFLENSAAEEVGILVNDELLKVNDQEIGSLTLNEVAKLLKGEEGSKVSIVVKRGEEEKTFIITRKKVEITSVTKEIIEKNNHKVGVLTIDVFAANTFNQFEKAFLELQDQGIDSLVVDVRNNSGGHLNVVEQIASLFVPKGKIIYQLETKGVKQPIYSTRSTKFDLPVVVLMNEDSASASEILAAALKESYGATLVGAKTYGKGTVQTMHQLSSGASIKYTIQKWLTPEGNWINETGIAPDVEVLMDQSYYENPSNDTDNQLQKTLEVLTSNESE